MNWYNLVSMGGYGAYVWTAYGITLLAFGINLVAIVRERRRVRQLLQSLMHHES